ncbi:glycosyl transferase [Terriglobus roseus DSM 18391]|uniref:Glycosyl transferase n=1 Tax=Terriglobus roseus (strain DSM 18391 / NRRL B-41598 / KBS 63) TaxID=926566 RepID=I3ZIH5_TERRK|nr:glycosyltransferase family 2 protein [Terriglobus roseus]AFL89043.1 glycosyl transferase [Terriglobus roseus DSM 18391]
MSGQLVSILVPTYNRADCLLETLDCVLAQTHKDWELILIDDGSTDGTGDLVAAHFHGDTRLRYIYQQNAGVSHARNTGLRAAKGDFITFLDSDDLWMPWKLEAQLACMAARPEVGMVWTDMEAIDHEGHLLESRHLRTMYSAYRYHHMETLFEGNLPAAAVPGMPAAAYQQETPVRLYFGDIFAPMILGSLVHTSTVMLRRERALLVAGFDETLKRSGEDYDFHLRTCKEGPVALLDAPAIRYRKGRADRLTRHTDASAINFLATVEKAVASDTEGRLRKQDVELVRREANEWIAEEKFKLRDGRGVRQHVFRALRRNPRKRRLVVLVVLSYIPPALLDLVLRSYRSAKAKLRG